MTVDFQKVLVRCLFQYPEFIGVVNRISSQLFDAVEDQVLLEMLVEYIGKFKVLPRREEMEQYFMEYVRTKGIQEDVARMIVKAINSAYLSVGDELEYVRRVIWGEVQRKSVRDIAKNAVVSLSDASPDKVQEIVDDVVSQLQSISSLPSGGKQSTLYSSAGFLNDPYLRQPLEGHPTPFNGLNRMTAAGGFHTPQLIVILSEPKAFKTGTILEIAIGYMKMGLKVYVADTENGELSIRNRVEQALMRCTLMELEDQEMQEQLKSVKRWSTVLGGDMLIDSWIAYTATPSNVRTRLKQVAREYNFVPDVIVWDAIDHFVPSSPEDKKKDERLRIKAVYFEVIAINKEVGCFSIAPSQVNRQAVNKRVINMKDFGEDFSKAANCHAAFAICRTAEEVEAGIARLVPVVQRQGKRYRPDVVCVLKMDEEHHEVTEISVEEASELLGEELTN